MAAGRAGPGGVPRDCQPSGRLGADCPQLDLRKRDSRARPHSRATISSRSRSRSSIAASGSRSPTPIRPSSASSPRRSACRTGRIRRRAGRCWRSRGRRRSASASPSTVPTWNEDPALLNLVYERCALDVVTTRAVFASPKLEPPERDRAPLPARGRNHQRPRRAARSRLRRRRHGRWP